MTECARAPGTAAGVYEDRTEQSKLRISQGFFFTQKCLLRPFRTTLRQCPCFQAPLSLRGLGGFCQVGRAGLASQRPSARGEMRKGEGTRKVAGRREASPLFLSEAPRAPTPPVSLVPSKRLALYSPIILAPQ